jgi:hypothetical protein
MAGFKIGTDRVDCIAWGNFNGANQAINDDYGFDSLAEVATGQYFANMTIEMANTSYAVMTGTVVPNYPGMQRQNPDNTWRARVWTTTSSGGSYADASVLQICIFGNTV